jgi:hypothetical protein
MSQYGARDNWGRSIGLWSQQLGSGSSSEQLLLFRRLLGEEAFGLPVGAAAADLIARWPHRADLITALTR